VTYNNSSSWTARLNASNIGLSWQPLPADTGKRTGDVDFEQQGSFYDLLHPAISHHCNWSVTTVKRDDWNASLVCLSHARATQYKPSITSWNEHVSALSEVNYASPCLALCRHRQLKTATTINCSRQAVRKSPSKDGTFRKVANENNSSGYVAKTN